MKLLYFLLLNFLLINAVSAQISGCTDPQSLNYNSLASTNDGSCVYPISSTAPPQSIILSTILHETSGIVKWNNSFLTHNDSADNNLYALDTITGTITQTFNLPSTINKDWEDIAQDENYIYVGDFGNNAQGNRTDLNILRITKESLTNQQPVIDTIYFSYANQLNFSPIAANTTDFDCEALIISETYIYLFTKQWSSKGTTVYRLPKVPGTHTAVPLGSSDVQGLITGATHLEDKNLIVLSGYTDTIQPFVYLLFDFTNDNFFSANKRKITIPLPFHQMEAITTTDGLHYNLTNEKLVYGPFVNIPQKLHSINLTPFLESYINETTLNTPTKNAELDIKTWQDKFKKLLFIKANNSFLGLKYYIFDSTGRKIRENTITENTTSISLEDLSTGTYFLKVQNQSSTTAKFSVRH